MKKCIAIGLAKQFKCGALRENLASKYRMVEYREVMHLQAVGDAFLFPFGVIVLWGVSQEDEQRLLTDVRAFMDGELPNRFEDRFEYEEGAEVNRIHEDCIRMTGDATLHKLALSHGIAQSVKLMELELYASQTIEQSEYIPRNMAETGSTKLSKRAITRMRGRLILVESDINHHYALLDTPEFFWEYPELEPLYQEAARYLEVQPRVAILNQKLQMIHKLFSMLADEQKHKHSSLLEWIIIWLIAVEIVIFIGEDLLHLF